MDAIIINDKAEVDLKSPMDAIVIQDDESKHPTTNAIDANLVVSFSDTDESIDERALQLEQNRKTNTLPIPPWWNRLDGFEFMSGKEANYLFQVDKAETWSIYIPWDAN